VEHTWQSRALSIHGFLTMLLAFLLPISKKMVPPVIVLWALTSFFLFRSANAKLGWKELLPLLAYYFCNVVWIIGSEDRDAAYFSLEVKASLLVFPAIWLFVPQFELRRRLDVLLAFIWGCIGFALFSIGRAAWFYRGDCDVSHFYYAELGWYFHPTYLATYEAFALVVLGRMYSRKVFALGKPWLHHLTAALLIVHIGLLSSRAGYLCALLALLLVAILQFKRKRAKEAIAYLILGISLLAAVVLFSPTSQKRLEEAVRPKTTDVISDNAEVSVIASSSTSGRMVAWKTAIEVLIEHPFGVGTGDVENELMSRYELAGEDYAARKHMNPHNQFLQAGVAFGWPGIFTLCLIFLMGFLLALKRKDFLFLSFLLLLGLNMLFESFLEVQSGVVFIAFFFTFFVKSPTHKTYA
jgi:O-antigen ligase